MLRYRSPQKRFFTLIMAFLQATTLLLCHCTPLSLSPTPTISNKPIINETKVIKTNTSTYSLISEETITPEGLLPITVTKTATSSRIPVTSNITKPVTLESPTLTVTPSTEAINRGCPTPSIIGELPVYGSRLALSPDGTLLATSIYSDEIRTAFVNVFDIDTGKMEWSFEKPRIGNSGTRSIVFSPDGSLLAAGGLEQAIQVWDLDIGEELYSFSLDGPIVRVAFSSDSKLLAACTPGRDDYIRNTSVNVWNIEDGTLIGFLDYIPVGDIAFSPVDPIVAIALQYPYFREYISQTIVLWNIEEGTTELLFDGESAYGVAISDDGNLLAGNVEGRIRLLNLNDKTEFHLQNPEYGTRSSYKLEFSSRNYLATLTIGDRLILWDPEGQLVFCYESENIRDFVFTNDGTKMYVNESGKVKVLNIID